MIDSTPPAAPAVSGPTAVRGAAQPGRLDLRRGPRRYGHLPQRRRNLRASVWKAPSSMPSAPSSAPFRPPPARASRSRRHARQNRALCRLLLCHIWHVSLILILIGDICHLLLCLSFPDRAAEERKILTAPRRNGKTIPPLPRSIVSGKCNYTE